MVGRGPVPDQGAPVLVVGVLGREHPDGTPTEVLQEVVDRFVEASVPAKMKNASRTLAVEWTNVESFTARPPRRTATTPTKKPPGDTRTRCSSGTTCRLSTMAQVESGARVPELVRRMQMGSSDHDPVPPMVRVLTSMAAGGIALGDVICDSGYAHRVPEHFALPLRAAGARLVIDLHPSDYSSQATHAGAILCNGNLYCPMTPTALFDLSPLARGASQMRLQPTTGAQP